MSTKPTTLPRWSTDLSNATEPSSGQKDTGWTPGQDGVSDYDNWVKYWNYKWAEYVSDGNFTGPITVTGDLTVTDDLAVTDTITTATIESESFYVPNTSSRTITFPAASAAAADEAHNLQSGRWEMLNSPSNGVYYPLHLTVGSVITSAFVYGYRESGGTLTFELMEHDPTTGLGTTIHSQSNNTAGPVNITLGGVLGTPHTVAAGKSYVIRVSTNGTLDQYLYGGNVTVHGEV